MFTLISLPYAPDALEPVISARTLEFHHGKHLQAYVDNLNKLLPGTEYESLTLEEIVIKSCPASTSCPAPTGHPIFNNAGQILNHNLYFTQFAPASSCPAPTTTSLPAPTGNLLKQIIKQWGTLDAFKAEFEAKGVSLFGSGWVWLSANPDGSLVITQEPGASNPLCHSRPDRESHPDTTVMPGSSSHSRPDRESHPDPNVMPGLTGHLRPLLTFDVWEHAYYLDYQNRRAAHLKALWGIVDWSVIEDRYAI